MTEIKSSLPSGGAIKLRSLLMLLVIVALLPLLLFSALMVYQEIGRQREDVRRGLLDSARSLSQAIDREIAVAQTVVQTLADSQFLDQRNFAAFYQDARNAAKSIPGARILLFDLTGQQLLNTLLPYGGALPDGLRRPGPAISDPNYPELGAAGMIRKVVEFGQPLVSDVFIGSVSKRPTVALAVPVRRDGKMIYVLDISFGLEPFSATLRQHVGAAAIAAVFDRNGIIIARTLNTEKSVGHRGTPSVLAQIAAGDTGSGPARTLEGMAVYSAFARSKTTGWATVVAQEDLVVSRSLWRSAAWFVGGGTAFLLLGVIAAMLIARSLARAIGRVAESADALQSGDAVDIAPSRIFEIEALRRKLLSAASLARETIRERERRMVAEARENEAQAARAEIAAVAGRLRESEAKLLLFVENAPAAVAMFDRDMRYLAFSRRWLQDYGLQGDVTGRRHYDVLPEVPARWKEMYRRCLAGAVEKCDEDRFERADGKSSWLKWEARPWFTAAGEIGGLIIFSQDISALKRANAVQARLAAIVDSTDDAILSKDLSGTIQTWNGAAERLLGYRAEEIIGQPVYRIIPSDRQSEEAEILSRIARGELIQHYETVRQRKNGSLLDVSLTVSPIKDSQGTVIGASTIARDVSARKRAEQIIAAQREYLRITLASIGDAVITTDTEGRITEVNTVAESLTGWTAAQAKGQPLDAVFRIINEETRQPVENPATKALRQGVVVGLANHTVLIAKDGAERPIDDSAAPIKNVQQQVVGCVLIFRDITERRRAEEALRRHAAQLLDADRRKDEFLATLAHELRNPLAPIRNAIALLKKPNLSAEHFSFARDITENQLEIMVRLIDDLLDVSRISRGKIELKKERVELKTIIAQAIETSKPHMEEMGHSLKVELPQQEIYLDGDRVRLAQVFGNLLNNAAKYSERNGKITLAAKILDPSTELRTGQAIGEPQSKIQNPKSRMELVVSVRDEGIGISPDHLPRLFEMFSQVESALTRSKGGLGIGLALVKGLVELHGGSIEAKSAGLGKGSEFAVKLPIVASEEELASGQSLVASEEAVINDQPSNQTTRHSPLTTSAAPRRVFVVDDNHLQARSLAMLIETMGFETRYALTGAEAVKLIIECRPHVALIDIGLPDMTGYELARRLRALPHLQGIKLIAQTGWGRDEDLAQAKRAGFDHHLTKPIKADLLEKVLRVSGA